MKEYLLIAMMMGFGCSLTDSALAARVSFDETEDNNEADNVSEEALVPVELTSQQIETLRAMLDKKMNKKSKDKGIKKGKKSKKDKKGKKSKKKKKSEQENTEE